ncbi:hypothetical protein [[Clostridium] polysaccharolyticum]|nr:hypothetical protein [[Clostridium] polysaccharolyticum]
MPQAEQITYDEEKSSEGNIKTNQEELKKLFQKWKTSEIPDEEKESIITKFTYYLKNSRIKNEKDLKEISDSFRINRIKQIIIIEYTEAQEIYGESGKMSYAWVIHNDSVSQIFDCDSKYIDGIIQDENDENIFYLYGMDYLMTSCSGVFVSRIVLNEDAIKFDKDIIEFDKKNGFSKCEGVLYGKSHLVIQEGNSKGTKMIVKELNGKDSLELDLTEKHIFKGAF